MKALETLKLHLIERTEYYTRVANAMFPNIALSTPTVSFFDKSTKSGKARAFTNEVAFNLVLAGENLATFDNTVIHEIAHLVVPRAFPRAKQHHGREFKYVMEVMGGNPSRCHNYDVSTIRAKYTRKQFIYSCACKEHVISSIRHNRAQANKTTYSCRLCANSIKFKFELTAGA